MKIRKYFCGLLGHRYHIIWSLPSSPHIPGMEDAYCGVADTEYGCAYCGESKPNEFIMDVNKINWAKTTHRRTPPENKTYIGNKPDPNKVDKLCQDLVEAFLNKTIK